MSVAGKTVLISGGARGMGAIQARAFAEAGANVIIGDVLVDETRDLAARIGEGQALAVQLDVCRAEEWESAVAEGEAKFGSIDVLVNNAGVLRFAAIEDCSDAIWDQVIGINLGGVFKGIRAVAPVMKAAGGGSIINISSIAGLKGFAGVPAYIASKFGVRGLTKAAALELAPFNIRVNSVHPGNIDTDMIAGLYKQLKHVPMERLGRPEEICKLVMFLAGADSSFSTGAEFVADGGETCGMPNLF